MRFLKLIGCDNSKIGTYGKLVKDRNNTAHPNGHIYYNTQAALNVKIAETVRIVEEIQAHSRHVIEPKTYRSDSNGEDGLITVVCPAGVRFYHPNPRPVLAKTAP